MLNILCLTLFFVKKYAKEKGISPEEAKEILYLGAKYYNNKATTEEIDKILQFNSDTNEQSKYTQQDIKDAYLFLRQESEGMIMHTVDSPDIDNNRYQYYFTSTQRQYEDNSMNVPVMVGGLGDTSDILFPAAKIGTSVFKMTSPLVEGAASKMVYVYDEIGQRSSLYLDLKAKPSFMAGIKHNKETFEAIGGLSKDGYYGTMNYVYDPKNVAKGMLGIEIANDVFNDSMPIPSTLKGAYGSLIKNIYQEVQSGGENTKSILNKVVPNE